MIKHGQLDVSGLGIMARMTELIAKVVLAKMRCLFIVWCHYSCLVTIVLYASVWRDWSHSMLPRRLSRATSRLHPPDVPERIASCVLADVIGAILHHLPPSLSLSLSLSLIHLPHVHHLSLVPYAYSYSCPFPCPDRNVPEHLSRLYSLKPI